MTIRTEEEIRSELARLILLKPKVIAFDFLGKRYRNALQDCIDVLVHNLSVYEIDRHYRDDETSTLSPRRARDWLDGREPEPPSEWGWPLKPQPAIHTHTDCLLDR